MLAVLIVCKHCFTAGAVTLQCMDTSLFNPDQHHHPISQLPLMWGWDWTSACEGCAHFLIWACLAIARWSCISSVCGAKATITLHSLLSPPLQLFFWSVLLARRLRNPPPHSPSHQYPPFFSLALVFVALIRLSLPQGPKSSPNRAQPGKTGYIIPVIKGAVIWHVDQLILSIPWEQLYILILIFPPDTISYIPTSVLLSLAKRLHLLPDNAKCTHTIPAL